MALWIGLLLHAFFLPWNYLSDTQQDSRAREAYQQFVRDTFIPQTAFVMLEGIVLGIFVATLLWVLIKVANRVAPSEPRSLS